VTQATRDRLLNEPFFTDVSDRVPHAGEGSGSALAFKVYNPEQILLGKRMEDWLRISVAYWHSFAWQGSDMFGSGTLDRPWQDPALDPMQAARLKMAVAFEFISKLGVPFYCFHDADIAPAGGTFRESKANLEALVDEALAYQEQTGIRLLWGTANLFSHPRYQAGAATNPDPAVFAYAAAQVATMLAVTKRLGGQNYVLWGGREGYDSLLNTDLRREGEQLARFLHLVAEEKHRIGFEGTLLIEPKPMEPTAHQYDRDVAVVHGFLARHALEGEYKLNIEANHATLAGHSFHHEVAYAAAHGLLGSIDANRGNPQNGWDTDQFPNSVDDLVMPLYEIVRAGGLGTGGFNFDAKLRRQSINPTDLFHAHIGGIDALARALIVAGRIEQDGTLAAMKASRYERWDSELGRQITSGSAGLADLAGRIESGALDPSPVSGRQEIYENLVGSATWGSWRKRSNGAGTR
jgi:xylose isomerase